MKFLLFLVFFACVTVVLLVYPGTYVYRRFQRAGKLKRHAVAYNGYPEEMPLFQEDNYYCRTPLGMSYGMIRVHPSEKYAPKEWSTRAYWISRPYTWYSKRDYTLLPSFCDYSFEEYNQKLINNYVGYVDIPFDHMTVLDGMINEGGFNTADDFGDDSTWAFALTRFTVNFTMDGKEWFAYRDKQGEIQEFVISEINRVDGILVSGYTKFEPRIIARSLRIVFISYRTRRNLCVAYTMEVFGCDYEPENHGLQRGFRARNDLVLEKNTLFPWQLYGTKSGYKPVEPLQQPFLALSRLHSLGITTVKIEGKPIDSSQVVLETFKSHSPRYRYIDVMPQSYGWCATGSYNEFVVDLLQEGTFTFKYTPIVAVYPNPKFKQHVHKWYDHNYADWCYKDFWMCAGYYKLQHRKRVDNKHLKIKMDGTYLKTFISRSEARKKPCVQDLKYSGISFKPQRIKRSTGCNSLLYTYGITYCLRGGSSNKQRFDIDLKKISILDSFSFRGHHRAVTNSWVTTLNITYSADGIVWLPVKDRYAPNAILRANRNKHHVVLFPLNPRLRARFLRMVPLTGSNGLCLRVEIRGCSKEIGFGLWLHVVGKWNIGKAIDLGCFRGRAASLKQFGGTQEVYRVIQNHEIPLGKNSEVFYEDKEVKFYKCVARNEQGAIVSTQLYIVRSYGHPGLILPIQEIGLEYNGGLPVLDFPGTVWTYEPYIGKLTLLFFPDMKYEFSYFGEFDKNVLNLFYLTVLGRGKTASQCLMLAVQHHHRYFVIDSANNECLSSWYLPLASKTRENKLGQAAKENKIYEIYEIHQTRKPYLVTWSKQYVIGSYEVKKETPHPSPVFFTQPYGMARYRFHFDSYVTTNGYDSHTLVIKNFAQGDVSHYSLAVTELEAPKQRYYRTVNLRHFGEPRLNITLNTGSCIENPLRITAVPIRGEYQEVEEWGVEWRKMVNGRAHATGMETSNPFELYAKNAALGHNGQYRIRVNNRYGFAEAYTNVEVVARLPTISFVTSSPHTAVEDTSDILQIAVANEEDLISVDWQFDDKPIEREDNHYSFPGAVSGMPQTRKILKLGNMHSGMSGTYKVTSKAKYCQFHEDIVVDVYVRPRMIVSPGIETIFKIAGGNTTEIKVVVTGGIPTPEINNLFWHKNSKPLQFTETGRVKIKTVAWMDSETNGKRIGWNSTLRIGSPHETDSGTYSFMISFPRANYTVERVVKVTKINEDFL